MDSLIASARKGSSSAMRDLCRTGYDRVRFICETLLPEKDAEEAQAAVFRWALDGVLEGRIETKEAFAAAVVRRALTESRMRAVGRNRRLFRVPTGSTCRVEVNSVKNTGDRVSTVLDALPPLQRFVCVAAAVLNGSPDAVSETLDVGISTVRKVMEVEEENIQAIAGAMHDTFTAKQLREELLRKADGTAPSDAVVKRVEEQAARMCAPLRQAARRRNLAIGGGVAVVVVVLALIVGSFLGKNDRTTGSSGSDGSTGAGSSASSSAGSSSSGASASGATAEDAAYTAAIEIEDYGTITVALDRNAAPKTVENFVSLARSGFYDGLTFHRIMEGFMMQGGDPNGDGTGGSEETIPGEFSSNGYDNPISHTRGTISMARSNDPDSASSQFFICQEDSTFLDGEYAAFGHVTEGMDVVDAICEAAEPIDGNGLIAQDAQPVIHSITITENAAQ